MSEPAWVALGATPATGIHNAYALLRDERAANTQGGDFNSGAWVTRILNTEVFDPQNIVTLAANQFVLTAGTYLIRARAPATACDWHKAKLRNITDSTDALIGQSVYAAAVSGSGFSQANVTGRLTLTATKTFELQHRCNTTKTTNGLGIPSNFGVIEIYSEVEIWRES